ncbi:MAG: LPS-assembly protein [Yoonia sp.]|jgi:LPS-assembly protein
MRILVFIFLLWLPQFSFAQGTATLVADSVRLNGQDQLIANGNVEVIFDGSRLTASEIMYDRQSDTLQITGPIFIRSNDGTILTADTATLDPRLENGILQSARIVLNQQLQIVATQIDRRQGRYSQLYKTSATSCSVCRDRVPLWEIRAERVIHDAQERQLYFENATFRVRGVPVFWLPRMRLPDPSLSRSTGFLVPEQRNTTQLGTGIKVPYFITLGDYRDLTVTPYVSAETATLELTYRQAFTNGAINVTGAISDDTLEDETRAYLFAEGQFNLADGFQLAFDFESVSDPAYLLDYDYSDKDRLDSAVSLVRVRPTALFQTRLTFYESLREDEDKASLPPVIAELGYEAQITPSIGGILDYRASLDAAHRPSNTDGDAGRDVTRAGIATTWQNTWIAGNGIVAEATLGAQTDLYLIDDDVAYETSDVRFIPDGSVTLRWPLASYNATGTTNVLEPTLYLGWAESYGATPPNEDSTRSELDRANLFSASRFAGEDATQTGPQVAAGLTWTRFDVSGATSTLTFGRVIKQDANADFTLSSGLDDTQSDWLLSGQVATPDGFLFDARGLWADDSRLTVADSRVAWRNDKIRLAANYQWQTPDAAEGRSEKISEWTLDGAFDVTKSWTLAVDGRYDLAGDRPVSARLGLEWRNECVRIDVSVSRRYTSSSTVEPTTTFGLSGSIGGFSTGRATGGIATGCGK